MRSTYLLSAAMLLTITHALTPSSKRGLIHIPSSLHPSDDTIWLSTPSPPTWYYNYATSPSPAYTTSSMHFVPMLWGAGLSDTGTPFYDTIKAQISRGANITHVLSFNEPDAGHAIGGSNISPALAATRWKAELEPLRSLEIKIGAPSVTGGESGWVWLDEWFAACIGGCTPDFMTVHWYGNYEGLMSHLGRVTARWKDKEVWVTEFGYPGQGVEETRAFVEKAVEGMDRWKNISRYAYFGAFRANVSNVGPNAAMLDKDGKLTDVGALYLGGQATGFTPKTSDGSLTCSF
ncbi:hypothetical protein BKA63DRAFT_389907, partial [Paraphoma chrysanthemicola]